MGLSHFAFGRSMDTRWLFCLLLLAVLASPKAFSQPIWNGPATKGDRISTEWLKPLLRTPYEGHLLTSSLFLSGQKRLSDWVTLTGDIPMSYVRISGSDRFGRPLSVSSSSIGNPYIGFTLWGSGTPVFLDVGLRVPLADERKGIPAGLGSLVDLNRLGAYAVNHVPLRVVGNYRMSVPASNVTVRFRGGPETYFPAGGNTSGEMILIYGVQAWYRAARLRFSLGLTGRSGRTQRNRGFRESSLHQASALLGGRVGRFRPAMLVRVPLETPIRDIFQAAVGIRIGVSISDPGRD